MNTQEFERFIEVVGGKAVSTTLMADCSIGFVVAFGDSGQITGMIEDSNFGAPIYKIWEAGRLIKHESL